MRSDVLKFSVSGYRRDLILILTTVATNRAIRLANLPLLIRVQTTLLASMCYAMPFSARALTLILC